MFHSGLPDRYEAIKFGNDRVSKIKEKRRGDYGETEEDRFFLERMFRSIER